jgi:hypothetical protein
VTSKAADVMMTGVEITAMLCGHYSPKGCMCPARRLAWWPERWLLGLPSCIYDDPMTWKRTEPTVCPHIIALEGEPE